MNFVRKVCSINLNAISIEAKKYLLKDFVIRHDVDVALLQEVAFSNFSFIPTHHAVVNRSSTNVGTAILIRKTLPFDETLMDPNGRITSIAFDSINVINVYGHSGSQAKAEREDLYEDRIIAHMDKPKTRHVLLGGDHNCILEADDCKSKNKPLSQALQALVSGYQLRDVGLPGRRFTFHRGESASRLDRMYTDKTLAGRITKFETLPVAFSDHHAILATYTIVRDDATPAVGRGYWKINDYLLRDPETTAGFREALVELKQRRKYTNSFSEWWSYDFKNKVKQFYKGKAIQFNQTNSVRKARFHKRLEELTEKQAEGENVQDEIEVAKTKLVDAEHSRLASYRNRHQPATLLESERLSMYQMSKIVKRGFNSPLLEVSPESGNNKQVVYDHFKETFAKRQGLSPSHAVLDHVSKSLPREANDKLIAAVEAEELKTIIQRSSKKKAPGPDGLTYEFYEQHFDELKDDLLKLYNGAIAGRVPLQENFSSGVITLIPKTGNKSDLSNYRPISLLNTDYKILTKILAARLSTCMHLLLGDGQTAGVHNQSCVDNLDRLRTIIARAQETKRVKFALLSLDLEKAFDSVDHDMLWQTLERFQVSGQFIALLKQLYRNASSQVLVNGFLTASFKIARSVRQGCPLSMLLFSLYLEPLIRRLHDKLVGMMINNTFFKVSAYADDLTILVRNDEEFDLVMFLVSQFSTAAGITLNSKKSAFLRLNNCKIGPQRIPERSELKILGLIVKDRWKDMVQVNYDLLIRIFTQACQVHGARKLCLLERVFVLNTYLLSKLWYISHVLTPSNKHLAQIKKISGYFLWKSHIFKVGRNQLYLDYAKGGLKLIDPESQCKALFIRNLVYKSGRKIDHFMLRYENASWLTVNSRNWISRAKREYDQIPDNNRTLYWKLIEEQNTKPKVEAKYPNFEWECIWENINQNFLSTNARSTLYLTFNDVISNKVKLFNYTNLVSNRNCDLCNNPDTNVHRIKNCLQSGVIWNWVEGIIKNRFKLKLNSPEEILYHGITKMNYQKKAALWLVSEAISYNIYHFKNPSLYCFQKNVREIRWNNKTAVNIHFQNHLNIC